jgi:hypothetical protein
MVYLLYVIFPVLKKRRLDPFVLKNQCSVAVLHLFSIKTALGPCLTLIINQTIIKFWYKNLLWCSRDHQLLLCHNRTLFWGFWTFKYTLCLRAMNTPSFFQTFKPMLTWDLGTYLHFLSSVIPTRFPLMNQSPLNTPTVLHTHPGIDHVIHTYTHQLSPIKYRVMAIGAHFTKELAKTARNTSGL